jgi:hypothetical protein
LNERVNRFRNRCLIVQIENRDAPIREKVLDLAKNIVDSSVINVREEPFWREIKAYYGRAGNLSRATLEWMESCDG